MKIKILLFLFLMLLLGSCKITSRISSHEGVPDLKKVASENLDQKNLQKDVLISNMNFKYSGDKNINAKLTFYSGLNNVLFASFRYLGFEVIRLGLFPDSIQYINRFQREYYFEAIDNLTGLPINTKFDILQPFLLTGFYYNNQIKKKEYLRNFSGMQDTVIISESPMPGKEILLYYSRSSGKLDKLYITDLSSMVRIEAFFYYNNYKLTRIEGVFMNNEEIGKFALDNIEIQHKRLNNTSFNTGKNYTKLESIF
jgi:hypothetical protein